MSELAVAAPSGSLPVTTMLRRTVAVVDMVGYSDVARMLEQNISALSVSDLNRQIQTFITRSLDRLPNQQAFCVIARTGDGIIVLFENPDDAHDFAYHIHLFAAQHNNERSEATAERWFRIGIATGDVSTTACAERAPEFAGTAIATAVRLETAARSGEILIDIASFQMLSTETRLLYASEKVVRGKRKELFLARRLRVISRAKSHLPLPHASISRRALFSASFAALGAASLGVWFERSLFDNWIHPLPAKRFVALLGWPPPTDAAVKPMLMGLIDIIVNELARAEAFDSNLFLTSQGTAADLTTPTQLNEARSSLGANLILATSVSRLGSQTRVLLQLLDSTIRPPIRTRTLTIPVGDQASLPRQAVSAAARLLNIDHYRPNEQRLRTGTSSTQAYALFQEAEASLNMPNDVGLDTAIAKYQQAASADPRYAAAHAKLGLAFCRRYFIHLDATALKFARDNAVAALNLDLESVDAHIALATVFKLNGDENGAFREFAAALSLDPSNPRALIEQARLYASLNRWDRAEDTFDRLLRVRPNLWLAHLELGVVFSQQGKYKSALAEFRAANMAKPSEAIPPLNIGSMLLQQGQLTEAIENLRNSFDLKPSAEAASILAGALRVQRNGSLALECALRAVQITPSDAVNWLELGDCYSLQTPSLREARDAYLRGRHAQETQLSTEPHNGPGWMMLGLISLKSGDSSNCRSLIAKAEKLGANDLDSQLYKVRILELLGARTEALTTASVCLGRGANPFQFVISPDLDAFRNDPMYKQLSSVNQSSTSFRQQQESTNV